MNRTQTAAVFVLACASLSACAGRREAVHSERSLPRLLAVPSASPARTPALTAKEAWKTEPSAAGDDQRAAPAYDLSADIEARTQLAREELGPQSDVQLVEGTFVVAAAGGKKMLTSSVDLTRRALAAYFNGRFTTRPTHAISVYLFPAATPYDAFCEKMDATGCISPYGFYVYDRRRIVMNVGPGLGTLTHELVHPLVEADFPSAPEWINEGIASLFEYFYFSAPAEIHGRKNWRYPRLVQALRSKTERREASLPALFARSDQEFRGKLEDLNYASARFFCQWLDQKRLLWPFYQRWRDHYAEDPSGVQSFEAVFGKAPTDADAEWTAWVLGL